MEPSGSDDGLAIPSIQPSSTTEAGTAFVVYPNVEQWLSYSVAMFPAPAQDSIFQSIVDFLHHRPHTMETLVQVVSEEPVFPRIALEGEKEAEIPVPKVKDPKPEAAPPPRSRNQPVRVDPTSPVARTTAPAAHALRLEEDSFEEPLKKFARNDEFQGNLPPGWRVEVVMRSKGKFRGKKADKYWYHPTGIRFKSFAAVQEYLTTHPEEMNTIEEKTPIVYRVSSRSRRDVPEHQSKSNKRKAEEAGLAQSETIPLAEAVSSEDSSKRPRKNAPHEVESIPESLPFTIPLIMPGLPKSVVAITETRQSTRPDGLLEFKTTFSDGSTSWEIATTFYDESTREFHAVYLDFLTKSATNDIIATKYDE